jgi:ectoine hydroxylase-related dioxygenase (phytanoyl-CoA dioxygenase family)
MDGNEKKYKTKFSWSKEQAKVNNEVDLVIEEIQRNGFSIIPNFLEQQEVKVIREKIEGIYATQLNECGGEDKLYEIGDQHNAKALIAYDRYFDRFLNNSYIVEILKYFLGEYFILHQQNGIIHRPESANPTHPWHRDLVYQHITTSRPIGITTLFSISDFAFETGATMALPGSHLHEIMPSQDYTNKNKISMCAPAGSLLILNSMMFHRGGHNISNKTRYSLNQVFTLPFIRQQISYPNLLRNEYNDNPDMQRLLGFNCETEESVQSARMNKINKVRPFQGWKLEH